MSGGPRMQVTIDEAWDIAAGLAEADPIVGDDFYLRCVFCGEGVGYARNGESQKPVEHEPTCLWLRAKQWTKE